MGGHVAHMKMIRYAYKILVGKLDRKMSIQRPRLRWEV
jgi:hypothetical protein